MHVACLRDGTCYTVMLLLVQLWPSEMNQVVSISCERSAVSECSVHIRCIGPGFTEGDWWSRAAICCSMKCSTQAWWRR